MEENQQSTWSSAAKDGLLLALFTIVFLFLAALLKNQIVATIVEILKIAGCIWFLRYLMLKWRKTNKSFSLFKYGMMICLFSSIVCAIFTFFEFAYIFPDMITETFDQLYESLGSMSLPSESMDLITKMEDNYPQWACISAFITDILAGLIFSAIIANARKSKEDIFADQPNENNVE